MFAVDNKSAVDFVRGFWNAHMLNWTTLEINRHGYYENRHTPIWASKFESPPPFQEAAGLSFINAGNDLIYAAGSLYKNTKENGALIWMMRMVRQYVKARNPVTQLGAYQYNRAKKLSEAYLDEDTLSCYGDRAFRQFGEDFHEEALEGKIILEEQALSIYYHGAIIWTKSGKIVGPLGKELIEYANTGLKAFAKYAYKYTENEFIPLLVNGTSLDDYVLKKDGYYGKKGKVLKRYRADERFLYSFIVVYCETQDSDLWKIIRNIGIGVCLGDLGEEPGHYMQINHDTQENSKEAAFAVLELYKRFGIQEYLNLAIRIADNIIATKYKDGLFINSNNSKYADFDSAYPLVLLEICATIQNTPAIIPEYMTGAAFIHGKYKFEDGTVIPYTTKTLFQ
jgi:pectate lyase